MALSGKEVVESVAGIRTRDSLVAQAYKLHAVYRATLPGSLAYTLVPQAPLFEFRLAAAKRRGLGTIPVTVNCMSHPRLLTTMQSLPQ